MPIPFVSDVSVPGGSLLRTLPGAKEAAAFSCELQPRLSPGHCPGLMFLCLLPGMFQGVAGKMVPQKLLNMKNYYFQAQGRGSIWNKVLEACS